MIKYISIAALMLFLGFWLGGWYFLGQPIIVPCQSFERKVPIGFCGVYSMQPDPDWQQKQYTDERGNRYDRVYDGDFVPLKSLKNEGVSERAVRK